MPTPTKSDTVIVFSESLEERDILRSRISESGFNVVCFEKEAVCFDNIKPISPKIIIAQTDSNQVAWRFIFALYAMDLACSLLVISDILKENELAASGANQPIYLIANYRRRDRLMARVSEILGRPHTGGGKNQLPLFLGQTDIISQIRSMVPTLAQSRDCLLVTGEKGTGKELLARLIAESAETENLLVKIDCGELSPAALGNGWMDNLIDTEVDSKPVTIYFDRIHLISNQIQAEILIFMEEADKWKDQHGSFKSRDIRFLATSEVSAEDLIRTGQFRKDLFYRLNVIPILMPPLRDRKEDIALLMDYFIIDAAVARGRCITIPSQKAKDTLYLYDWPGNVEELKTYMRRISLAGNESCILANSNMPKLGKNTQEYFLKSASMEDLPKPHEIKSYLPDTKELSLKRICAEFVSRTEKKLMQKALESTNWNRKKAAQLLNISYKSMLNKMKTYDIV